MLGAIERVERRKTAEEGSPALLFEPALFDQIKHRGAAREQEQRVAEHVDGDVKSKEPPTHRVLGPAHEARAEHEGESDRGDEGAQRVDVGAAPQNEIDAGRKQRRHRREEMHRLDRAYIGVEARQAHVNSVEHRGERQRPRGRLPARARPLGTHQVTEEQARRPLRRPPPSRRKPARPSSVQNDATRNLAKRSSSLAGGALGAVMHGRSRWAAGAGKAGRVCSSNGAHRGREEPGRPRRRRCRRAPSSPRESRPRARTDKACVFTLPTSSFASGSAGDLEHHARGLGMR